MELKKNRLEYWYQSPEIVLFPFCSCDFDTIFISTVGPLSMYLNTTDKAELAYA